MKTSELKVGKVYDYTYLEADPSYKKSVGDKIKLIYTGKNLGKSFGFSDSKNNPWLIDAGDVEKQISEEFIPIKTEEAKDALKEFKDKLVVPQGYKASYSKFFDAVIIYKQ